ncbi:hypothetical protein F4814DRAFT_430285, partial [Daldinia grandis]
MFYIKNIYYSKHRHSSLGKGNHSTQGCVKHILYLSNTQHDMPETLREKATKRLQGPDANPSQLGDPISIKAEQSDTIPTKQEEGAANASESSSRDSKQSSKNSKGNENMDRETLREKATKKLQGPNANPSQKVSRLLVL